MDSWVRERRAWLVLSAYSVPVTALAFCMRDILHPGNTRLIKSVNDSTNYVLAITIKCDISHEGLYDSNI